METAAMTQSAAGLNISDPEKVSGSQVRAARALLGWSTLVAAAKCGVGENTISRLETGQRSPGTEVMRSIVLGFEEHGALFIETDLGIGVILNGKKPPATAE